MKMMDLYGIKIVLFDYAYSTPAKAGGQETAHGKDQY
jgi:hypothetical protein